MLRGKVPVMKEILLGLGNITLGKLGNIKP